MSNLDKHIYGIHLDKDGRCAHYHTKLDIVALKCNRCHKYFACYKCHDELENHKFSPVGKDTKYPVMCGHCRHLLTYKQYQIGHCPYCHFKFNPKCALHHNIYFKH